MTGAAYYMRLDELVDVIGETAALRLVAALGGTRFYVRERQADGPIVEAIGPDAARVLSAHIATGIGGMWVEIPRGPSSQVAIDRRRLLERAGTPGLTESGIARELRVHGRTVRRARARLRAMEDDDGQGRLF